MQKQTEHSADDTSRSAYPRTRERGVFLRAIYAVFPWHDPQDYPGCLHGMSEALGMNRNTLKSNAYKARGTSANACRSMADYLETRISAMQSIVWELRAYADERDRKTASRPGARALARLRQQKAQNR